MNKETLQNKMLGCLYGQAIGDALDLGTELIPHNLSEIFSRKMLLLFSKKPLNLQQLITL